MNVGKNLITLRKSKSLTQEDLAEELKVSRQAISKWELGLSKPDLENASKLSKLFKITIDKLVNNEIVETEAISVEVKKEDNWDKVFIWVRRFMILLIIFFISTTIYKFVMLFKITHIEQQYKELNNYHYVITTYDEVGLIEKEECWFKDGISKTVNTLYGKDNKEVSTTNINYNTNEGYTENQQKNSRIELNISNLISDYMYYAKGGQLYSAFPKEIRNTNLLYILGKSFDIRNVSIKQLNNNLIIGMDKVYINLQKNSLLPILIYFEDENTGIVKSQKFDIELNVVEDIII